MNAEDFVTFKQALKLKQLGFKEECLYYYDVVCKDEIMPNICYIENDSTNTDDLYDSYNKGDYDDICDTPTLRQVQQWFIDHHKLYPNPLYYVKGNDRFWVCSIMYMEKWNYYNIEEGAQFPSYNAALSAGITECLNLLKDETTKTS